MTRIPPEFASAIGLAGVSLGLLSRAKGARRQGVRQAGTDLSGVVLSTRYLWEHDRRLSCLASAEKMLLASDHADDEADYGPGAWMVKVSGLDKDFEPIDELVPLRSSPTPTKYKYARMLRMRIVTAGKIGTNRGTVTATAADKSVQCAIAPGFGVSESNHYTIPAGKRGILLQVDCNAASAGLITFRGRARSAEPDAALYGLYCAHLDTQVTNTLPLVQPLAEPLSERTDLWLSVSTDSETGRASSRAYMLLADA